MATLAERSLDFADAAAFFDGRAVLHQSTPRDGEPRWKSTACIDGQFFTVVWIQRDESLRIISMRRAHEQEIRKHREFYG
jgi:uncharacterized DUF497 family protein